MSNGARSVRRPVIGVTGRRMPVDRPFPLLGAVAIQESYVDAVDRGGGLPAVLAPRPLDSEQADAYVAALDGIVISGGPDIDPARYGQLPHVHTYGVSGLQDDFEAALIDAATRSGTPVLCICRGMQLLNVMRGGTLHQHLDDLEDRHQHGVPAGGQGTRHRIEVDPSSRLATVLGTTEPTGECHHHQAIDRIGDGLRAVAWAADGTIEGLEPTGGNHWLVAVQWHPEDTASDDAVQQALLDELVRICHPV